MILKGVIQHGHGRGRALGVPTLNLDVLPEGLEFGVYAVRVRSLGLASGSFLGALHWGPRPTFGEVNPVAEVHVLDAQWDAYGQMVEVELGSRLREVRRFASPEELKAQIALDIAAVRAWGLELL